MKKLILIIGIILFISSCENNDDETQYPTCLQSEVERILESTPQSPRATIKLYLYQGNNVYIVITNFPVDQSNIYNSNCEIICSVGGIDGNQNDTCVNWESAELVETVWTDNK